MDEQYLDFCEGLWQSWLARELAIPDGFENALPEPYLTFDVNEELDAPPLMVLTYNPGGVLPFQEGEGALWEAVGVYINAHRLEANQAAGLNQVTYAELSRALGDYYHRDQNFQRPIARARINGMLHLSRLLHCNGVIQIESCPFHSANFKTQRKLAWLNSRTDLTVRYRDHLAHCVQQANGPVVAVSGCGALAEDMVLPDWLHWQAGMLEINHHRQFVPLAFKNGQASIAALIQNQDGLRRRALSLLRGNNTLPAHERRERLADEIGPLPHE